VRFAWEGGGGRNELASYSPPKQKITLKQKITGIVFLFASISWVVEPAIHYRHTIHGSLNLNEGPSE
jgi:hypothetical protein